MGLRLQFNLVLTVVFVLGLGISGFISNKLLRDNARDEVVRSAELMIQAARAVRAYTVDQVRPELSHHLDETFLPESVPAYAAANTIGVLPAKFAEFAYREATLNPTNPRNRAADWEADLIREFQRNPALEELTGERDSPAGRNLYIASPLRVTSEGCLTCHSTPATAPASMLALYGNSGGFGWKLNDIIGTQVVSIPMSVPIDNANRAFVTFMLSLLAVFVVLYVALNLMLTRVIIKPITSMSRVADDVSMGNFDIPEFDEARRNEIGRLATSFNRMRRSLEQAMRMIDE